MLDVVDVGDGEGQVEAKEAEANWEGNPETGRGAPRRASEGHSRERAPPKETV